MMVLLDKLFLLCRSERNEEKRHISACMLTSSSSTAKALPIIPYLPFQDRIFFFFNHLSLLLVILLFDRNNDLGARVL